MQANLVKTIHEIYVHYMPFIEDMIKFLEDEKNQEPLVGDSNDSTLRKVYGREGYMQALRDVLDFFRKTV